MTGFRIEQHPILSVPPRETFDFYWRGQKFAAKKGETIASALFANDVRIFGHHPKDNAPQGLYCANGQCAQCLVLADGKPVKSCMELVEPNLRVEPVDGLPVLPRVEGVPQVREIEEISVPVLIIGGGAGRAYGRDRAWQAGYRDTSY